MTTFALIFMLVSMTAVTALAAWCLYKTIRHDRAMATDDDEC